jgi:5-(carboxyamino)imidazole ribonucleotide mutase/phosphoribosylaminoimidazole-succinocarboxamide synthase
MNLPDQPFVIILMGSASDRPHCDQIAAALAEFGLPCVQRIASAHKNPVRLLGILGEFEASSTAHIYITVAGRSNALSGMVDGAVSAPVIACPPQSSAFGGADLYSSVRMPSGIAPMLVLEPANAALAAAKILALQDPHLARRLQLARQENIRKLEEADAQLLEQAVNPDHAS